MQINILATNIHNIEVIICCFLKENKKDLASFCGDAALVVAKR